MAQPHFKKNAAFFLVFGLLLSFFLGLVSCDEDNDDNEKNDPYALAFEPASPTAAPDPMSFGPFPVGAKTFTFTDTSRLYKDTQKPRVLVTEVWYPAIQTAKDGPFFTYDLYEQSEGQDLGQKNGKDVRDIIKEAKLPGLSTKAVRDAAIDKVHGPYPIVLFSHGANGIRFQSTFFTVLLASHGYIVISADHEKNTTWDIIRDGYDAGSVAVSASARPADMTFILDKLLAMNKKAGDFFEATMDEDNIGISGHSLGGLTSIAASCTESRIKVAVPMSPVIYLGRILGKCNKPPYPTPTLVMGGTEDRTVEYKWQYCDYLDLDGSEKYLYEIEAGGHYTFSDMCQLDLLRLSKELDFGDAEDALNDGCGENNADWREAQQTINYYAVAYLNWHLRGSTGSKELLKDRNDGIFAPVNFYEGDSSLPDWADGGCKASDDSR